METPVRNALGALSAAYFVLGTGSLAVVGLIEPMATHWHTSQAAVAQLVTVFALAFALLAPLVQVLSARLPRRALIVSGLFTLGLGLLGTAWAPSLSVAIAFRVLTALGAAAVGPVASSLATCLVPSDQQAKALAVVFGGMTVATVLGVPLAAWLGHVMQWQAVFVVLAGAAITIALAVFLLVRDSSAGTAVKPADLLAILRRPASAWALGATLLQMAAQFATYTLIALVLRERFSATVGTVSAALMVFGIAGVAANALVGRLGDRVSTDTLIQGSLLALAAVFALLMIAPARASLAILLVAAWALVAMAFNVPQQKRLISLAPAQRGLLLAANASALYLGMSLGAVAGSTTHELVGVAGLPALSMVMVLAAFVTHRLSQRALRVEGRSADRTQAPSAAPTAAKA